MFQMKIEMRGKFAAACFLLAATLPASATSLDPISYVSHLCLTDSGCSDPNSGTEASGTGGGAIGSSVFSGVNSEASFSGSPSPAPNVLAATFAAGGAFDARANVMYQYYFKVLGPAGDVSVTLHATLMVGGSSFSGAIWSSFASLSIGDESKSIEANSDDHITPSTLYLNKTKSILEGKAYLISLYADAHAQSFGGDAANGVFASIDPTITIDGAFANDYSIVFSDGIVNGATPLPPTWTMLIAGFFGLGVFTWRGAKKSSASIAAA